MTSAYIIANVEVTNPTQYEDYKKWSSAAMQAHGAEVCVRGGSCAPAPARSCWPTLADRLRACRSFYVRSA